MNSLLNDIVRGKWAISPDSLNALLPFVDLVLSGKKPDMSLFTSDEESREVEIQNSSNQIAIIPIQGIIRKANYCGSMGLKKIEMLVKHYDSLPNIIAIIFDMDSPGGEASYLNAFVNSIEKVKTPTISYYSGTCASACYYIASSTDYIFSGSKTDVVGSIGTMITMRVDNPDFKVTEENQQRFIFKSVYADKSVDKNRIGDEAKIGNFQLMKSKILNPLNEQFHADVKSGRPDVSEDVFSGDIYLPEQAMELGLIDGIKDFDAVIEFASTLGVTENHTDNFNNNTTNMNKYFLKVSAILGREVTSYDQLQEADYEAIALATTEQSDDAPEQMTEAQVAEMVSTAVATATEGMLTPEAVDAKIATALEKAPAANAANAGNVDGGGEAVESWNDPDNQVNKEIDQLLEEGGH